MTTVEYLMAKGLHVTHAGPDNVRTACVFCHDRRGRALAIYVGAKKRPGTFKCHHCSRTGDLSALQRHFGDLL
jgi:hypothetical protein